jgi:inositol oxygenase
MGKIVKNHTTQEVVTIKTSDKATEEFRNYVNSPYHERVRETYKQSHINQTYEFGVQVREEICSLKKKEMGLWEVIELLNEVVDESDPDTDLPQLSHLLQTAEAIRKEWPGEEYEWFHLAGFLHDVGKILAHKDFYSLPQWATVGDTFVVGCKPSKKNIFPEYFAENPDATNPLYNTKYGVYSPNCGLDQVMMSFGHDEYLYQVCTKNNCTLPLPALYIIRYHSFYSWHHRGAYKHLVNDQDKEMLKWVKEFQKFDLYSKDDGNKLDVESLKTYYQGLINKYFPRVLNW